MYPAINVARHGQSVAEYEGSQRLFVSETQATQVPLNMLMHLQFMLLADC